MNLDDQIVEDLRASVAVAGVADADALAFAVTALYDNRAYRLEQSIVGLLRVCADQGFVSSIAALGGSAGVDAHLEAMGDALAARTGRPEITCQRAVQIWAAALGASPLAKPLATAGNVSQTAGTPLTQRQSLVNSRSRKTLAYAAAAGLGLILAWLSDEQAHNRSTSLTKSDRSTREPMARAVASTQTGVVLPTAPACASFNESHLTTDPIAALREATELVKAAKTEVAELKAENVKLLRQLRAAHHSKVVPEPAQTSRDDLLDTSSTRTPLPPVFKHFQGGLSSAVPAIDTPRRWRDTDQASVLTKPAVGRHTPASRSLDRSVDRRFFPPSVQHVVEFNVPGGGNDPLRRVVSSDVAEGSLVNVTVGEKQLLVRVMRPLAVPHKNRSVKMWLAVIVRAEPIR